MTSLGQALKEEREARNISIEEIVSATKIVPRYIEALENDHFDLMPGGFFIKGIIRTYARAIGLDGEEVLARYRAAGVIEEPEHKRSPLPRSEPAPAGRPIPKSEPPPPVQPDMTPSFAAGSAPELPIQPASKSPLTSAARKRIVAWAAGGAMVILVIAVLFSTLTSRRPRPRSIKAAVSAPAPAAAAVSLPLQTPAIESEPIVEDVWTGVTIEISFQAETWIQVYTDGVLKVDGLFPPGAKAKAQATEKLLIHVGNAGGFTFLLNGKPARPLGRSGQVITDIKITPDNLKDFLQSEAPGQPAG